MAASPKMVLVLIGMITALICFVTGLLIGWFLLDSPGEWRMRSSNDTTSQDDDVRPGMTLGLDARYVKEADPSITSRLLQEIQASNIERHLRFLTERPHLAGTEGDQRTVDYVKKEFQDMGYDVTLYPYDVVLSYPEEEHFNKVSMLDGRGRAMFTSNTGVSMPDSGLETELTRPYCIYSPSGKVKGKLVYANYGRPKDFKLLERKGVDTNKAIIIIRQGKHSAAEMVREAAKRGGVAAILYNDPDDVGMNVTYSVYPATWWLPGDDVEHGNIRVPMGDPATPGYAATEGAYRISEKQMELPEIPCHPVGYSDAKILLQNLEGDTAPDDWQGQLGFDYRLGTNTPDAMPVEMSIKNTLETRRIYNVVATLKGATEPDRVVVVGSHRDAVTYGGVDPGSGNAVMLEMARAFANLSTQGWQPRRSIMFCSWAAKEFGMIGSTEWVEEKRRWLGGHVVAYMNVDAVLQGNYTFDMSATPSLTTAAFRAAGKVPDPHAVGRSVLDTWKERMMDERTPGQPWIRRPVCNTDLLPFMHLVGVPVTHSRYSFLADENGRDVIYQQRHYPLYHTVYDTAQLVAMMDPHFAVAKAVAAVVAEMTRDLADSLFIPINVHDYGLELQAHLEKPLEKAVDKFNSSVVYLQSAMDTFLTAATAIQYRLEFASSLDPFEIRRINDKLMLFEREFVDQTEGLHLFLSHGSNSNPSLDRETMSKMTLALEAAAAVLTA